MKRASAFARMWAIVNKQTAIFVIALAIIAAVVAVWNLKTSAQSQDETEAGKAERLKPIDVEAARQIAALIEEKESRTAAQKKIDSKVLQAIRESRGETMARGVTTLQRADIGQTEDGFVVLDLRAAVDDKLLAELRSNGAEIISSFPVYDSVRIRIKLEHVEKIAALDKIKFVSREMSPDLDSIKPDEMRFELPAGFSGFSRNRDFLMRSQNVADLLRTFDLNAVGTVASQGDRTHRVDNARTNFGHQGEGIKIGVISDSYNFLSAAASDITSGNLPGVGNPNGNTTPITVIQDAGNTDEGRAMLQIVHDLVPKAQLYFATANGGAANFGNNIVQLKNAGCNVIIDDVSYTSESPFQSGPVGLAVENVTAAGVLYFASAGNAGSVLKNTAGVWEGDFEDNGGTNTLSIPGNSKVGTVHDFDATAGVQNSDLITGSSSRVASLYWADPLGGSSNDYDLFVMNNTLTAVVDSSTTTQNGTQDPFEVTANPTTANNRIVIFKSNNAVSKAIHFNTNRGVLGTFTNGQTRTHSATVSAAYNVAAAPAVGPFPNAFSNASILESFSSDGPRRMFFNSNGTPITPNNFKFSTNGGVLLAKPDLTAADGVATTFPTSSGLNPFFGTSAAAPHAGAIAALMLSVNPSLTPAQVRTNLNANAVDVETPGIDVTSGVGIIQAFQSVTAISAPAAAGLNIGTVTVTETSPSNNNGIVDPGDTVNVVVQLTNPSGAAATNVSATLGPAMPGLNFTTVGPASYGTIAAGGNASNTAVPFKFKIDSSTVCGTAVPVVISVSLGGGASPISFNVGIPTGAPPQTKIDLTTTLDLTTPPSGTGYTAATGTQNNRLNRNGVTSTCAAPKTTPNLQEAAPGGVRHYDSFTMTNNFNTPACYTISYATTCNTGTTLYSAAYGAGGFQPANIQANYLGDSGVANGLPAYSINVPANSQFTVVLHEVAVTANGNGCTYTINVSGVPVPACSAAAVQATISGQVTTPGGIALRNARVILTDSGGLTTTATTSSFGVYTFNNIPLGNGYTVSVQSKRYRFSPSQFNLTGDLTNLNFVGLE
ncbi:MAG: S8 family serine peptidase [Pyrinomonadaceae bacterium]